MQSTNPSPYDRFIYKNRNFPIPVDFHSPDRVDSEYTASAKMRHSIPWDGSNRRALHLAVVKERRTGYILDTPDFAEKARLHIMSHAREMLTLSFAEAFDTWLEQRRLYIRESTAACYVDYGKRLKAHFTQSLKDTHIGMVVEYQSKMRKLYHPASVNHDINVLSQMMKSCDLWAAIQPHYRPLPLPEHDPLKVMSEKEESEFFEFASKNPDTWLAYWVASFTNNTTASGKELRMLQLEAISLDAEPPFFRVPKNMKTPQRQRVIPLNERGVEIMRRMLDRANSRGSTRPEHYLFSFRIKRNLFDPNRPASESWIKAQWKQLVDEAMAAGVIKFRIKPHNLRHQAITKLLDYGVPIETVRQLAGHGVDSLITRHYHHGRMETLARAVNAINPQKKAPAFSTPKKGKAVSA